MKKERGGPTAMPAAEVLIDVDLLGALVARQFPTLASCSIEIVANGWDNVVARLGDDLAIRAPRRSAGVALIDHECTWLPEIARRVPIAVPTPVHRGEPDHGFPWPWAIVAWVDGTAADLAGPATTADADTLADVLRALATPAPVSAPRNPYRGVPLADRAERVGEYLERIGGPDHASLTAIWSDALAAPVHVGPPVWLHGDLHPGNLVVRDGRLAGVIDWGDLTSGDPAADLQVAWTWFGPDARARFLEAIACDPDTVRRARGNALAHGAATVASSADNPRMAAVGAATLRQVLLDGVPD
jgi:aminoglycoside phosphotransferase (APT) family kinase protein